MAKSIRFTVTDPVGLYATPATELVDKMKSFTSNINLHYSAKTVNLKSLMGVLSLGIPTKAKLEIVADGPDEEEVIKAVETLIETLGISTK